MIIDMTKGWQAPKKKDSEPEQPKPVKKTRSTKKKEE